MNKIREAKKAIYLKNWKEEVEAQVASGLTVCEWCRRNNVNLKTYYYHLRKVREVFIEFSEKDDKKHEIVAVAEIAEPIRPIKAANVSNAVIIRKDGMEVEIPENISPQMLKLLLEGLKSC